MPGQETKETLEKKGDWWLSPRVIQARQLWKRLSVKLAVIGFSLALSFILVCWFLGISNGRDAYGYFEMAVSFPPVWKELAFRRFGLGDNADKLLRNHPPTHTKNCGEWSVHDYTPGGPDGLRFSGLWLVCKGNVLVAAEAGSCTWEHKFFEDAQQLAVFHSLKAERSKAADQYVAKHSQPISAEARFDSVFLRTASPEGDVSIIAWLESQEDLKQLQAFVASNPPPYGVSWRTKVESGFRTNEDFQKKSALLRESPHNFAIP